MRNSSASIDLVYPTRPRPLAGLAGAAVFDVPRPLAGLLMGLGMAIVAAKPEITYNNSRATKTGKKAKDGVEIRFGGKVTEEVIERLKAANYRYSSAQKMWYNLDSLEARTFAESLASEELQVDDAPTKTVNFWVVAKSVAELWKQSRNTWYKVDGKVVKSKAALMKYSGPRLESSVNMKKVQIMIFREVPVDSDGTAMTADPNDPTPAAPTTSTPPELDLVNRHKAWAANLEFHADLLIGDVNPERIAARNAMLMLAAQHRDETKWDALDRSFWGRVQTRSDVEELLSMTNGWLANSEKLDQVRTNLHKWAELTIAPQFDLEDSHVQSQKKTLIRVLDDKTKVPGFLMRLNHIPQELADLQAGRKVSPAPRPDPTTAAAPKLPAAVQSMLHQDIAERLRTQGDALTKQIDAKLNSGTSKQRYTARRGRIAAGMAADGLRLKEQQDMLYALATMHENDAWHSTLDRMPLLANIRKRTEVEGVLGVMREASNIYIQDRVANNPDFFARLLTPPGSTPKDELKLQQELSKMLIGDALCQSVRETMLEAAKVVREVLNNAPPQNQQVADAAAEAAKRAEENKLRGSKIPGFFPTPPTLINRMLTLAGIHTGDRVLEPSAGKGDIADAIRARHPNAVLSLCEINYTLREHLKGKGYDNVMGNFLTDVLPVPQYDRVLMNPPFENGQDIEHVMHAYKTLMPGGILVAIMGESAFSNSYSRNKEFHHFLTIDADEFRGQAPNGAIQTNNHLNDGRPVYVSVQKNEAGAFVDSFNSTGVATRMLYLVKPLTIENAAPAAAAPVASDDAARNRGRALVLIMKMRARALTLDAGALVPAAALSGVPERSKRLGLRAAMLALKTRIVKL